MHRAGQREPYVLVAVVSPFPEIDLVGALEGIGLHPETNERAPWFGSKMIDRVEVWVVESEVAEAMRLIASLGLAEPEAE
jgi:hypothetical protein